MNTITIVSQSVIIVLTVNMPYDLSFVFSQNVDRSYLLNKSIKKKDPFMYIKII